MKLTEFKGYDTDKSLEYLKNYEIFFKKFKNKKIVLLELGIFHGGSLKLWNDYFSEGIICGLDMNKIDLNFDSDRVFVYQGNQDDSELLDRIAEEKASEGFDIIIDDASHIGNITRRSFNHLFHRYLKKGGIYVIEDWGTGYWDSWPDGKKYEDTNHMAGMVGFIKELVDECGWQDVSHPKFGSMPSRNSFIEKMQINHGQVIIQKHKI